MVVDQVRDRSNSEEEIDRLFHALADATRRDIIVRSSGGELSVSGLARNYAMSVTAIQKHVSVLEAAGLIHKRRHGREQIVTPDPEALATARAVLDGIEAMWRDRLARFGEVLAELPEGEPT